MFALIFLKTIIALRIIKVDLYCQQQDVQH